MGPSWGLLENEIFSTGTVGELYPKRDGGGERVCKFYIVSKKGHKKLLMLLVPLGNRNDGKTNYSSYVI